MEHETSTEGTIRFIGEGAEGTTSAELKAPVNDADIESKQEVPPVQSYDDDVVVPGKTNDETDAALSQDGKYIAMRWIAIIFIY